MNIKIKYIYTQVTYQCSAVVLEGYCECAYKRAQAYRISYSTLMSNKIENRTYVCECFALQSCIIT